MTVISLHKALFCVGSIVGLNVGAENETPVGLDVGRRVGSGVGMRGIEASVGLEEGLGVGRNVGSGVGSGVGGGAGRGAGAGGTGSGTGGGGGLFLVGCDVGSGEGGRVGTSDTARVGFVVGFVVGTFVCVVGDIGAAVGPAEDGGSVSCRGSTLFGSISSSDNAKETPSDIPS